MKILQICAVDFTLYHFLMPLIRAERTAGHEVVAACADGPLADLFGPETTPDTPLDGEPGDHGEPPTSAADTDEPPPAAV